MRIDCRALLLVALFTTVSYGTAQAGLISGTVSGDGVFGSSLSYVNDGYIPPEGTEWTTDTTWWFGSDQFITIDFGDFYTIEDLLVSVDNNDMYVFSYSTDGTAFTLFAVIPVSEGEIGFGMDTFSSESGDPEYYSGIDFTPIVARYIRIQSATGDNANSVGEVQAFGESVQAVPEPASLALLGLGALGLGGAGRRPRPGAGTPASNTTHDTGGPQRPSVSFWYHRPDRATRSSGPARAFRFRPLFRVIRSALAVVDACNCRPAGACGEPPTNTPDLNLTTSSQRGWGRSAALPLRYPVPLRRQFAPSVLAPRVDPLGADCD